MAAISAETCARVLVVDDNPATLYSTARVLRSAHFEVTEAATGQDALELALQGTDLMMLDVNLPDIHGFDVCRRLRSDPRTVLLPIIHLSATFVKESDKAQGMNAGSDGYLTHPVEPPVLIATVNAFLRARRAEQQLRESEGKFREVFENAQNGIVILDRNLHFIEVNPALCRILNRSREELLGSPMLALAGAGYGGKPARLAQAVANGSRWNGRLSLTRPNGSEAHLEWHISANRDHAVGVATDISDRVDLEHRRRELLADERVARAEAERANRLKDEFLSNVSHELRTPLNAILLYATSLQEHLEKKDQLLRGLQAIERNARMQAQLVSDLLDISRITSGTLNLDLQPTDLAAVISSSLEAVVPGAVAREIELRTVVDPELGPVWGDPARLRQIVWNLVSNAIKFTQRGGRVEVKLRGEGNQAVMTVADNGQGIKPDLMPYLFQRFRQGEPQSARSRSGLGLGLAIVRHLTELHNGSVEAASEGQGRGAVFTVRLPLAAASDSPQVAAAVSAPPAATGARELQILRGIRVLIVDDDADSCNVMARILERSGAAVSSAVSADSALAKLAEFAPQVLVSDVAMPSRDGFSLIREIRQRGHTHQTLPAIALTALSRPEDRRRALLAGFQSHLAKPINGDELVAAIAALVGRTGGRFEQSKS